MDNLLSVFLFTVVMTITPGPNNIMILASGLNFGIKRSIPHLLGIAIGFPMMLIAVGFGLETAIKATPAIHTFVKIAGLGYLLFLAYKLFTTVKQKILGSGAKPLTFLQAVLFQWVNPKAWVMIFSGVGVFTTSANIQEATLLLALSFFIAIFPCNGSWLFLGSQMKKLIKTDFHYKVFNRIMAILLLISVFPSVIEI
ncbi:Transporter, LysE family [uncultured Gammaproteobacteria bacterium]|uniref:LysE family translocator n=1 Tax=Bathymodiolus heckerae thiotrophic gill symbiont TaxID=1052212 RepID=UPI0010BB7ED0|nr:LysE family translocator [Bathymodiolus heckerae thiotrophic gill symbiont]CAC9601823.1 Transporter, LysE family [uncultured Gammaproteobacteria bacterium]SHN90177.1 Transporter, LysE family [Bathymodiolus heckerae thiotrophic gill symbiont]